MKAGHESLASDHRAGVGFGGGPVRGGAGRFGLEAGQQVADASIVADGGDRAGDAGGADRVFQVALELPHGDLPVTDRDLGGVALRVKRHEGRPFIMDHVGPTRALAAEDVPVDDRVGDRGFLDHRPFDRPPEDMDVDRLLERWLGDGLQRLPG